MPRRRRFDEADVLDRAMQVFARHGYEGASMAALTKAMGLAAPSVYAAFGSKRGLFDAVLDRHVSCGDERRDWILGAPTAREVVERWFAEAAETLPGTGTATLLIHGGIAAAPESGDVPAALASRRLANELALWDRLERGRREGDLGAGSDPRMLAALVATVTDGMAIRAAAGAGTADLKGIAGQVFAAWPSNVEPDRID